MFRKQILFSLLILVTVLIGYQNSTTQSKIKWSAKAINFTQTPEPPCRPLDMGVSIVRFDGTIDLKNLIVRIKGLNGNEAEQREVNLPFEIGQCQYSAQGREIKICFPQDSSYLFVSIQTLSGNKTEIAFPPALSCEKMPKLIVTHLEE